MKLVKNKNKTNRCFPKEEMVEFSNDRMSVPGNRLVVEDKESYLGYNPQNEPEHNTRSIWGSFGETEEETQSGENAKH